MGSGSLLRSLYHSKRAFVKALQKSLSPNRYSGLDRWIVKGVKTRVGAAMSVWLYDLVRAALKHRPLVRNQLLSLRRHEQGTARRHFVSERLDVPSFQYGHVWAIRQRKCSAVFVGS